MNDNFLDEDTQALCPVLRSILLLLLVIFRIIQFSYTFLQTLPMLRGCLARATSIASTSVPLSPPSVLRTALSTRRRFNAIEPQSRLLFGRTVINKAPAAASNVPPEKRKSDATGEQQHGEQATESPEVSSNLCTLLSDFTVLQMTELRGTVDKLRAENAELLDKYKRALAETENVRARSQREIQQARLFAVQGFCKDLLDVRRRERESSTRIKLLAGCGHITKGNREC